MEGGSTVILTGNTLKTYGMKSADLQGGGGGKGGGGGGEEGVNVSRRSSGSASSPPSAR